MLAQWATDHSGTKDSVTFEGSRLFSASEPHFHSWFERPALKMTKPCAGSEFRRGNSSDDDGTGLTIPQNFVEQGAKVSVATVEGIGYFSGVPPWIAATFKAMLKEAQ